MAIKARYFKFDYIKGLLDSAQVVDSEIVYDDSDGLQPGVTISKIIFQELGQEPDRAWCCYVRTAPTLGLMVTSPLAIDEDGEYTNVKYTDNTVIHAMMVYLRNVPIWMPLDQ